MVKGPSLRPRPARPPFMTPDRLFLIPLALGHVALFVLIVNVSHALGHPERVTDRAKLALLALFAAVSGLLWDGVLAEQFRRP